MNVFKYLSLLILLGPALFAGEARPLSPVPVGSSAQRIIPPADPNHFMFAVCGDNRATARGVPMPPTARRIFAEFRLLRPAFCLWTGDAIYGSDDTIGEARGEYDAFLSAVAAAETPIFNAPGNHEISERKDLEALYERSMGKLYGSFDYGNSHFIALDTEEVGRKPGIASSQKEWLERDLDANKGAAHIFVFTHHPLFPMKKNAGFADPANCDEIHRLFEKHGVTMVFSGHEHLFYKSVHDGITYVVTGGGGAPNSPGPEEGGFQHYVLVTVNGAEAAISVVEPWRLFEELGPVLPDGSCTARIDNYASTDFSVLVEFPSDALLGRAVATASFTYKGWTEPLSAVIVPPRNSGSIAVRVTVPRARSVLVSIAPSKK